MSTSTTKLIAATAVEKERRNGRPDQSSHALQSPETIGLMVVAARAIAIESATTIVEWPSEKKKPTATGRLPSCISLRVTLSIAEMWSASTACRNPNV